MNRRNYLRLGASSVPFVLAGCSSQNDDEPTSAGTTAATTTTATTTLTTTETTRSTAETHTSSETARESTTTAETRTSSGTTATGTPIFVDSFSDRYTIEEDHWSGRKLTYTSDGVIEYSVSVREGPAVDVFTLPQSEYSEYRNSEPFEPLSDATDLETRESHVETQIARGDYVWLVDNTDEMGKADPPTETTSVTVDVEVMMYQYE